ncbi:hypothetical protein [Mucilaginibacter sp.]|uniref:hypothetical protein n=1 Tax=Mucilaginibacter sp. TaxID=1882438 RepID=UPI003D09E13F
MALGRSSGYDWISFLHLLDRSYPKFGHTLKILFPGDIEKKPKLPPLSDFNDKLNKALNYNPKKDKKDDEDDDEDLETGAVVLK